MKMRDKVRKRLPIGTRVVAISCGTAGDWGHWTFGERHGVVVGYSHEEHCVGILRDGRKTPERFAADWFRRAPAPVDRESAGEGKL